MEEIIKICTLILISSVKFAFGPSFAYLDAGNDFTFLEANFYSILGGMIGVIIFMYFSDWLMAVVYKIKTYFFRRKKKRQLFSKPMADVEGDLEIHYQYVSKLMPPKTIFSKRTRRMVRLWKKHGLVGLAALTPIIFSIPIGTFIMSRMEKNKKKILFYMFISITCWSLLLTTILHLTHVKSLHEIL